MGENGAELKSPHTTTGTPRPPCAPESSSLIAAAAASSVATCCNFTSPRRGLKSTCVLPTTIVAPALSPSPPLSPTAWSATSCPTLSRSKRDDTR
jgi:hypothetical protein